VRGQEGGQNRGVQWGAMRSGNVAPRFLDLQVVLHGLDLLFELVGEAGEVGEGGQRRGATYTSKEVIPQERFLREGVEGWGEGVETMR
jgi:hypothetical protein